MDNAAVSERAVVEKGWWFETRKETSHCGLIDWRCPQDGCDGIMRYSGELWPTFDPGYHHRCTNCGLVLAIHGTIYPKIDDEYHKKKDGEMQVLFQWMSIAQ